MKEKRQSKERLVLKKGESKTITKLLPYEAFMLADEDGKMVVHEGEYEISVGGCGPDARSAALVGDTLKIVVNA